MVLRSTAVTTRYSTQGTITLRSFLLKIIWKLLVSKLTPWTHLSLAFLTALESTYLRLCYSNQCHNRHREAPKSPRKNRLKTCTRTMYWRSAARIGSGKPQSHPPLINTSTSLRPLLTLAMEKSEFPAKSSVNGHQMIKANTKSKLNQTWFFSILTGSPWLYSKRETSEKSNKNSWPWTPKGKIIRKILLRTRMPTCRISAHSLSAAYKIKISRCKNLNGDCLHHLKWQACQTLTKRQPEATTRANYR